MVDEQSNQPVSRRTFLRRVLKWGSIPVGGGLYATRVEPFWLDLHEFTLHVAGLPAAFEGFRLAQLSDLHMGDHLPISYLQGAVEKLNAAEPDAVAVTGDVLHDSPDWIERAGQLLGSIRAPVIVSLGNHDYAAYDSAPNYKSEMAVTLAARLMAAGCTVLRNQATTLERGGQRLIIVGMEDLWSGRFNAHAGMQAAGIRAAEMGKRLSDATMIVMSHNPDTIQHLLPFNPAAILCGHTHGGQVRIPGWGAILLPVTDRHYDRGLFTMGSTRAYVSRGVGYLRQIRFCCRPELPIHVLRSG